LGKRDRWKAPSREGPAVSVSGASKSYNKVKALSSVNIEVKRGEMFGLIGPNGAGKSTLMKSLIGTVLLDDGAIRVLGLDPKDDGLSIKASTGYVPESETPPSFLKLDEFLDFVMDTRGRKPDKAGKKKWVEFFDLESHRETVAKDMSKGTRQKLMLSSAFIHDPPLMLLDEPFINLDPIYQRKVKDYLLEYVKNGGTVLISTHILSLAEEICDRVAIINKGKELAMDHTGNIVKEFGSLENAFLKGVGYCNPVTYLLCK
jgi:ABC-2 type transport system ATP-binding protein